MGNRGIDTYYISYIPLYITYILGRKRTVFVYATVRTTMNGFYTRDTYNIISITFDAYYNPSIIGRYAYTYCARIIRSGRRQSFRFTIILLGGFDGKSQ